MYRMGPNRTPPQVIRNDVDTTTSYLRGVCETSASPPSGRFWSPGISNKRQYTSPNLWNSDEFGAAVDRNFFGNPIITPVLIQVFNDKLSNSSSRDIYARCNMHLAMDPFNPVIPQFVTHGLSTVNTLNKGTGVWIPGTRSRMPQDDAH